MTMCPYCREMAPRSHDQLRNRLDKIDRHPEITVWECPRCGGTEWATTDTYFAVSMPGRVAQFLFRWFGI